MKDNAVKFDMFIKRAIGISILIFVASLVLNVVWERIFNVKLKSINPYDIPSEMWFTAIASAVVLSGLGAMWFFKSPRIVANAKNGFLVGFIASLTGFILDIVVIAPLKNGLRMLSGYFLHWQYWTAFILIIISSTIIGSLQRRKV